MKIKALSPPEGYPPGVVVQVECDCHRVHDVFVGIGNIGFQISELQRTRQGVSPVKMVVGQTGFKPPPPLV